jgi:hypothetical protein
LIAGESGTSFYANAFAAGSWDLNQIKEARMRKVLLALPIIAAAGFATPAMAYDGYWNGPNGYPPAAGVVAGAAAGTTVALGAYNGWWAGAALPATTAGSIAVGGVAGIGALAMTDAVFNPCAGFHALFDASHGQCVDGHLAGARAARVAYETGPAVEYRPVRRHHYRHHYRR